MSIYCNVTECLSWRVVAEPITTNGLLKRTYTGKCSRSSIDVSTTTIKRLGGYRFDLSVCKSINQPDEESVTGISCSDTGCKFNYDKTCIKLDLKDSDIYIDMDDREVPICKSQAVKSRRDFIDWTRPYETAEKKIL